MAEAAGSQAAAEQVPGAVAKRVTSHDGARGGDGDQDEVQVSGAGQSPGRQQEGQGRDERAEQQHGLGQYCGGQNRIGGWSGNLPAEVIAKTGDLRVVSGYRAPEFWRCDDRALYRCPQTQRRCGQTHVTPKPRDVFFDDLVRGTAAGLIVPIEHRTGTKTHRFWVTDADRDRLEDHNSGRPVLPPAEPEDERDLPTGASHRAPTCRPSVQAAAAPVVEPAVAPPPIPIQPLPSRPIGAWPFAPSIPAQPTPRPKPSAAAAPAIPRQPGPQDRAEERLLDWRSSAHWSSERRPCRYCSVATNLRDEDGVPSHKTCAEDRGPQRQRPVGPGM
ncbi:hypothetical protein [Streptomyces sp. NPDC090093]|uniref:hypothetical protein n=1 Tax=Streptomyces sp. NPDC090093 TaxID=3365945 RepID=UPI0037F3FD8C